MQTNDFSRYLAILCKRIWMILLLFAITMIVIMINALTAKPVYQAAVRLQIIPVESEQVALYSPTSTSGDSTELITFQFSQIVRSSKIAWRTITQLGLNMDAETLLNKLSTTQEYGFITVIAGADTPQDAEAIVTMQVEKALSAYRGDQSRPAVVTGEFISQQLAEAERALTTARADLLRFKLNESLDSLDREMAAYQELVRNLRSRREDAILAEKSLTAQAEALAQEIRTADAEAQQAKPESAERGDAIRRASDLRGAVASLRGEIAGQRAIQIEYDRAIVEAETELTSLIGLSKEYTRLQNQLTQAQNTRDFLFNKALEAQLKQRQGLSVGYLQIVDPASRPERPLPNRIPQLAVIGGVLSLVLGTILAFLFEFIDTLMRNSRRRSKPA